MTAKIFAIVFTATVLVFLCLSLADAGTYQPIWVKAYFSPRCTECRCSLVMRILSVRLSVCPSNTWFVTKL